MAVLDYHMSDAFSTGDGNARYSYYAVSGVPTAKFNGRRTVVGGGTGTFNAYLSNYNLETAYASFCTLTVFTKYDSDTRLLKVWAKVSAVDTFSNARLRYAIAEDNIYCHWGGPPPTPVLDSVQYVVRKMLPNYSGVVIPKMNANDVFTNSQSYTLSPSWDDHNCYVVIFVQRDDSNKPVLRSAKSGLSQLWVSGDANTDRLVDVGDVVYLINYLFKGGPVPFPLDAADVTCDNIVDVGDVVYLINYLFKNGPAPGC